MKIALITLSPVENSVSALLLGQIGQKLAEKAEITELCGCGRQRDMAPDLSVFDRIVLAAPVYVNALPAEAVAFLTEAEKARRGKNMPIVYLLSNCGFAEGENNYINFRQVRHWCDHCGFCYGYSVGFGYGLRLYPASAGDMTVDKQHKWWSSFIVLCRRLAAYDFALFGRNFAKHGFEKTMKQLVLDIEEGYIGQDRFVRPTFPKSVILTNAITNLFFFFKLQMK